MNAQERPTIQQLRNAYDAEMKNFSRISAFWQTSSSDAPMNLHIATSKTSSR